MEIKARLKEIGLNEGEIKVYLSLLKLGSVPVSKIKEDTKLHRTTIYDFVEKLLNKGLVNYVIRNNIKYYNATHPSTLLDYVKEKEQNIKEILPELVKISDIVKEDIGVEVYKGAEGFKTVLNEAAREKGDTLGFGVDETEFEKRFPIEVAQYFKKIEKLNKKDRIITSESAKFIYKTKSSVYKYIPDEYFYPTPTIIYGDKVAIIVWEPLSVIILKNKGIAESYRRHFELLWKIAKDKPKSR